MRQGIYEELITKLVKSKLDGLEQDTFFIKENEIDKEEAKSILSQNFQFILKKALGLISGQDQIDKQIELVNKLIIVLRDALDDSSFDENLIHINGKILKAIFSRIDFGFTDFENFLKEITPESRLIYSSLFTGGGGSKRLQLDGELQKEINSSDEIDFLVSFIKWNGLRLLMEELKEFTRRGGKLRIITTTYVGATDAKSVEFLSSLPNTEVKVSYNTRNERVHVKSYMFRRNTGFHTAYIGSSNISKSALTKGLEWNVKITSKEVPHVIDTALKTFESYWQSADFETYEHSIHSEKLKVALKEGKFGGNGISTNLTVFDIKPYKFQEEILEKLEVERSVHGRFRNLVVAATGTGKTVISAFDFVKFYKTHEQAKLLFVAHRKEILQQSLATFRGILKNQNFGELWVDGEEPSKYNHVFASVQTLNNRIQSLNLSPDYFDFIIIDEVHHISASSYRPILSKFSPTILLGLTATPERMDGADILEDFCDHIAAEIRLPEALNQKLLCPFNYFGITDNVDLSNIQWARGRYIPSELNRVYTGNDQRVGHILNNLEKYLTDIHEVRALGFCVTQEHAKFMAEKFVLAGLKADFLISNGPTDRDTIKEKLLRKEINYLFVVDIFNEGVDVPEIDTVLFLRPTESLTVFLQQLGRGLRLSDGKDCLSVLDFVGNARSEYDFEGKFRAMIGKTSNSIQNELERNFPHVPLGCTIILEKKAKETILKNIKEATRPNRNQILNKIRNFRFQTDLPLTIKNFCEFYHLPIQILYQNNRGPWKRLCVEAGVIDSFDSVNEKELTSCIKNKWLSTKSSSYFKFILKLAKQNFEIDLNSLSESDKLMCLMLHYDFWQREGGFDTLEASIRKIGANPILKEEIIEVLSILLDEISFMEFDIDLPYEQPLKVHARYTRDQILVAFGLTTFEQKSSNREGAAENKKLNTEILFVDLIKSEEHFSPTTMYEDYAINEILFHWQSQNSARPDLGKGLSYITHKEDNKNILLFIREEKKDEFGKTNGYVFIGEGKYKSHYGSKPMSINWELKEPIPHYLWSVSAKLNVG
jgi:superfamily II DNA or RNA helicase